MYESSRCYYAAIVAGVKLWVSLEMTRSNTGAQGLLENYHFNSR
jgi:hypothetical protein